MKPQAPLELILLAQSLGAGSEIFGQRLTRKAFKGSTLRIVISASIYCALQAFLVLAVTQYALPTLTAGQGAIWMWKTVWEHPAMLLNAVNNSVYWLALSFILREPLGAIMLVLAFLSATFLVDPFSTLVGLPSSGSIPARAIAMGLLGALLLLADLPLHIADRLLLFVCPLQCCRRACFRQSSDPADGALHFACKCSLRRRRRCSCRESCCCCCCPMQGARGVGKGRGQSSKSRHASMVAVSDAAAGGSRKASYYIPSFSGLEMLHGSPQGVMMTSSGPTAAAARASSRAGDATSLVLGGAGAGAGAGAQRGMGRASFLPSEGSNASLGSLSGGRTRSQSVGNTFPLHGAGEEGRGSPSSVLMGRESSLGRLSFSSHLSALLPQDPFSGPEHQQQGQGQGRSGRRPPTFSGTFKEVSLEVSRAAVAAEGGGEGASATVSGHAGRVSRPQQQQQQQRSQTEESSLRRPSIPLYKTAAGAVSQQHQQQAAREDTPLMASLALPTAALDAPSLAAGAGPAAYPYSGSAADGMAGAGASSSSSAASGTVAHLLGVAVAFFILALTTATGIVLATYFEQVWQVNSFGYTAIDQVLLPLTTLPLAALIDMSSRLRAMIGEPPWKEKEEEGEAGEGGNGSSRNSSNGSAEEVGKANDAAAAASAAAPNAATLHCSGDLEHAAGGTAATSSTSSTAGAPAATSADLALFVPTSNARALMPPLASAEAAASAAARSSSAYADVSIEAGMAESLGATLADSPTLQALSPHLAAEASPFPASPALSFQSHGSATVSIGLYTPRTPRGARRGRKGKRLGGRVWSGDGSSEEGEEDGGDSCSSSNSESSYSSEDEDAGAMGDLGSMEGEQSSEDASPRPTGIPINLAPALTVATRAPAARVAPVSGTGAVEPAGSEDRMQLLEQRRLMHMQAGGRGHIESSSSSSRGGGLGASGRDAPLSPQRRRQQRQMPDAAAAAGSAAQGGGRTAAAAVGARSRAGLPPSFWATLKRTWQELLARPDDRRHQHQHQRARHHNSPHSPGLLAASQSEQGYQSLASPAAGAGAVPVPVSAAQDREGELLHEEEEEEVQRLHSRDYPGGNGSSSSSKVATSSPSFSQASSVCASLLRYVLPSRPLPFWCTLLPFHGLEFLRTLLFFYLITSFDTDATYLQMNLVRIVLCWMASLLACTLLRRWVGLRRKEAATALHPTNLSIKVAGSGLLTISVVIIKGFL